jgi:hypothetical protein
MAGQRQSDRAFLRRGIDLDRLTMPRAGRAIRMRKKPEPSCPPLSVHDPNTGNQPAQQPKRNAQTDFGLPCATRTDYHQPLSVLSNI